jgi:dinuclear metal center YbgI/SA1388 family protein
MARLAEVVGFLDGYFRINAVRDPYLLNGLLVEGKPEVKKILLAVDSSQETFEYAAEEKFDIVIVHHGMFSTNSEPVTGVMKNRIKILLDNGISLYGAHIPLDIHPEISNAVQFFRKMDMAIKKPFYMYGDSPLGYIGELAKEEDLNKFADRVNKVLNAHCKVFPLGKAKVKSIAFSSGASGHLVNEAVKSKVDVFIGGDARLAEYLVAKEAKLNLIDAGHHATETVGISALKEPLEKKFSLDIRFVDFPVEV